jgi:LacI family transcriptional regulator, galactose operon repressor
VPGVRAERAAIERATPALTSVPIPAFEASRRAEQLLMDQLAGAPVPTASLLEPQLTARSSSA